MFHVKDGLYFERLENNSVRVVKMKTAMADCEEISFEATLDRDAWASVISSVSKGGESGYRYYLGLIFHNSPQENFLADVKEWAEHYGISKEAR